MYKKHKECESSIISPVQQKAIKNKIRSLPENITWTKGGRRLASAFTAKRNEKSKSSPEKKIFCLWQELLIASRAERFIFDLFVERKNYKMLNEKCRILRKYLLKMKGNESIFLYTIWIKPT